MAHLSDTTWRVISLAPAVVGVLLTTVSVSTTLTSLGRTLPGSFRVVTGRVIAGLGGLALAAGVAGAVLGTGGPAGLWLTTAWAGSSTLGLGMIVYGVRRARKAPADAEFHAAHRLARRTDGALSPDAVRIEPSISSKVVADRLLKAEQDIVTLIGNAGSGKTATMMTLTLKVAKKAAGERRPERIALYVSLAGLSTLSRPPTTDELRAHVIAELSPHDTGVADHATDFLLGRASPTVRMILFLDAVDELASSWSPDDLDRQCAIFVHSVGELLQAGGGRFRAVLAARTEFGPNLPGPTVEVGSLTRRQQWAMMRLAGVTTPENKQALADLRRQAPEIVQSPLTLGLWCEDLRQSAPAGSATRLLSTYDAIRVGVRNRLAALPPDSTIGGATLRTVAETVAARVLTDPNLGRTPSQATLVTALRTDPRLDGVNLEAALLALGRARLLTTSTHTVSFTHPLFLEYFGASWLMGNETELTAILDNPRWQRPLATAVRWGDPELRLRLMTEIGRRAAGFSASIRAEFDDIATFLDAPARRDTTFVAPVTVARFVRSEFLSTLLIAATACSASPGEVPADVRYAADRLIVLASAGGSGSDLRRALGLLPLASPEVASWAVRQAIRADGAAPYAAARVMAVLRLPIPDLPWRTRANLIRRLAQRPDLAREIARMRQAGDDARLVPSLAISLIQATRVTLGLMVLTQLQSLAHTIGDRDWLPVVVAAILILAALLLLARTLSVTDRGDQRWEWYVAAAVWGWWVIIGGAIAIGAPEALFGDPGISAGTFLSRVLTAYVFTWPVATLAGLFVRPPLAGRERWYPQWPLAKVLVRRLITLCARVLDRGTRANLKAVSSGLGGLAVLAYLVAIFALPLPFVERADEQTTRQTIFGASIGLAVAVSLVNSIRHNLAGYRRLRRRLGGGNLTGDELLELLDRAGQSGQRTLFREIQRSARAGHGLRGCADVLMDLERSLDIVNRLVSPKNKERIPVAVWDLGGPDRHPGFREWLERYDGKHPGRLTWLATKQISAVHLAIESVTGDPLASGR